MESQIRRPWQATSLIDLVGKTDQDIDLRTTAPLTYVHKEEFFPMTAAVDEHERSKYIIHPESAYKLVWDVLAMGLIFYQAIAIPYLLAFEVENILIWNAVDMFITVYFATDITLTFNTAYYHGGKVINSREKIAKNYLKCWFWIDFLTTFPYDLIINEGDMSERNTSNAAQLLRILKFYRILRLLRLAKLKKILIEIEEFVANHSIVTLLVFVRLVIFAIFIAHWIACFWYFLAVLETDEPKTWITESYMEDETNTEIYITALYWAFTTMTTVGYGDIHPENFSECIFGICAMAISCAMFAYIVGSISGLVSKQTAEQAERRDQIVAINAYIKEKKFNNLIKFRIRRYLDFVFEYKDSRALQENDLLKLLSEPLRDEIFVYTRGQTLNSCLICTNFPKHFLLQLTKELTSTTFAPADIIFEEGERTHTLYFIEYGSVELIQFGSETVYKELFPHDYFGEISFFCKLPRCCSARCLEFTEVLAISRTQLVNLLERYPDAKRLFDYYESECASGELSPLSIRCYFCCEVGHVAANCHQFRVEVDHEKMREKWLANRLDKGLNPHDLNTKKGKKANLKKVYRAANAVGKLRNPDEHFQDQPELEKKIKEYKEFDSMESKQPSILDKTVVSGIEDYIMAESDSDISFRGDYRGESNPEDSSDITSFHFKPLHK